MRLGRHLRRKLRSRRGQALVEFALVIPIFLMLVCGIVEFARLSYVRLTVRRITQEAVRFAVTGRQLNDATSGKPLTRIASIRQLIQTRADDLMVHIDSVSVTPADGGGPGDVVQIRVFYQYRFTLAPLDRLTPKDPMYFSVGSAMKNEPVF